MKRLTTITAVFAVAACAGFAAAQMGDEPSAKAPAQTAKAASKLKVGDPAPGLNVEKWVKGDPITGFEKGRVYVVEFWATWCGPCIASMPHLSELQKEYKDKGVTIVGVTSADKRNTLAAVEKMVESKGDKMAYTVAWDKDRSTNQAFMEAADMKGIPCSFVVDQQGNIAYIGHPSVLGLVLPGVVDKKWDYSTSPAAAEAEYKKIMGEKRKVMRTSQEDPKAALTMMGEFEAKYPKFAFQPHEKFDIQVQAGSSEAKQTGETLLAEMIKEGDAMQLNDFAWHLVDPDGDIKNPPLDIALKAAEEANRLTENKNDALLDTLARVWWLKGDKGKAIEIQRKAVEHATEQFKEELTERLREYEADSKN